MAWWWSLLLKYAKKIMQYSGEVIVRDIVLTL
jgi:hypothetical protein